jgi:hypothetical protein
MTRRDRRAGTDARTVVIVNGTPDMRGMGDAVLESGDYVVVIAESLGGACALIDDLVDDDVHHDPPTVAMN